MSNVSQTLEELKDMAEFKDFGKPSKKKDCAFQLALGSPPLGSPIVVEDTDLITFEQATKIWNRYLSDFKSYLVSGNEPEMAIWVDMEDNTDYHKDLYHLDYRDGLVVEDGRLYEVNKLEVGEL